MIPKPLSLTANWAVATSDAYLVTHALPLAYTYSELFGTPLPVVRRARRETDQSVHYQTVTRWRAGYKFDRMLCLDIPSLLQMKLLGARCDFLYHALISKQALVRNGRPHKALAFAERLFFPSGDQVQELTSEHLANAFVCGHLPYDWLSIPHTLLPQKAEQALRRWMAAPSPRILLLGTRGRFGAWTDVCHALGSGSNYTFGVKLHPSLPAVKLDRSIHDLSGVPVPLLAKHSQLVIGDHSSATLEALHVGCAVATMETPALIEAEENASDRATEFAYLSRTTRLRNLQQLLDLLDSPGSWRYGAPEPVPAKRVGDGLIYQMSPDAC